jgi:hypothetical protein
MCQYSDGRREAKQWKCVGACDAKNLPAGTGQVAGILQGRIGARAGTERGIAFRAPPITIEDIDKKGAGQAPPPHWLESVSRCRIAPSGAWRRIG